MRAAVRQTRPTERLVRRSKAEAPAGFNRQRQWRLKTIRLVLPTDKPLSSTGVFRLGAELARSSDNTASVINIGSIAGMVGHAVDNFSYAISKAGVHQLTRILSAELAKDHLRVNAIAPGRLYSKMPEFLSNDQEAFEAELQTIPMRRWGEATDITGVAIMLASQAGTFITGQIIPVGGSTSVVN